MFEANRPVIADLRQKGALVYHETYEHSYPHCWRTDTPLIYRAVSSWFVKVTAFKDKMLELNQQINWVPAHVRDGAFGKWLEGARDWSIIRNRFWGAPVPVWKSDDPHYPRVDVYGSLDELEADFGVRPTDLHRPAIDELVRANPDDPTGQSMMRRVEDVLDCWFESGSMPFAQVHYPFENADWFEGHFPADFIVEYVGQTRGWFYTLHVLASARCSAAPRSRTAWPTGSSWATTNRSSPSGCAITRTQTKCSGFMAPTPCAGSCSRRRSCAAGTSSSSAGARPRQCGPCSTRFGTPGSFSPCTLTRWLPGQVAQRRRRSARPLRPGQSPAAGGRGHRAPWTSTTSTALVWRSPSFLDALNNWYIRRSRDRFWSRVGTSQASDETKSAAYDTLYTVLHTLCLVVAPLLPMVTETVYRGLTGERSVHLADWPELVQPPKDDALVAHMDTVRAVCSAGHSVRKAGDLRARLPLGSVMVAGARATELGSVPGTYRGRAERETSPAFG